MLSEPPSNRTLASLMLSEGCHKWPSDYTMFFVRRASPDAMVREAGDLKGSEKVELGER